MTRAQLRNLGFGERAIDARVRSGLFIRVRRGIYAVGSDRLSDLGHWLAAVLAVGEPAALSHRSAAALWGMRRSGLPLIDVTVPRSGRRQRRQLEVHRSARLSDVDLTCRKGIPVTRPARTALDLAEVVERRELERALDEAHRLRLCSVRELHAVIDRHPGRRGGAIVAAVLGEHALGSTRTVNDFEEAFLALCDEIACPRPEVNVWVGPYKVDFLWRRERLIVETDGYASHSRRSNFEADRARDVELENTGWRVRRFTWRQLTRRRDWVGAKLVEALENDSSRARAASSR